MPMDVTCALIEANGRVLAARRAASAARGGLWEFPGGKIASGETEAECLHREIREELGAEVELAERLPPVLYREPERTIRLIPFCCSLARGTPRPLVHERIQWLDGPGLLKLAWCPADRYVLRQYLLLRAPWLADRVEVI